MHENFKPKALRNCRRILELNYRTSLPRKNGYSFFPSHPTLGMRIKNRGNGRENEPAKIKEN